MPTFNRRDFARMLAANGSTKRIWQLCPRVWRAAEIPE